MTARAPLVLFALLWAQGACAEAPLSAIDWLSDSVAPRTVPPAADALPPDVDVAPLDEKLPAGVGLVEAAAAGYPADLWTHSRAEDVAAAFGALPRDLSPPLVDLVAELATLAADPPATGEADLLLARIDTLLSMAQLETARALMEAAGDGGAELFRRRFDIQLLTGNENCGCAELEDRPDVAPTYPARIFCLARRGAWPAAALTLQTAKALDMLAPHEQALLSRFLQDGMEDTLPPPASFGDVAPLEFRMLEAIGEPLPTRTLPLPFAHAELRPNIGWKVRIEAAERLARAGALPGEELIELYTERQPAASGGVWRRVAAARALSRALEAEDDQALAEAVAEAVSAMGETGLLHPLAEAYGAALAERLPGSADVQTLALLTDTPGALAGALAPETPEHAFLAALAQGEPGPAPPGAPVLFEAVAAAWTGDAEPPAAIAELIAAGRSGEAMLRSADLLARTSDPADIAAGLTALRRLGHEATARRVALDMALAGRS